jgi:cell division protein FtsA
MASKQGITVVVDIGSSKIRGLAGIKTENGRIEILGHASVPSKGIKRGVVLNIDEFSEALAHLVEKLEIQAEIQVKLVDVSIAGQAVQTLTFDGIRYTGGNGIVSRNDIDYLMNEARNMPIEPGNKIYHIVPHSYTIDDEPNITEPIGYAGRKVHARFRLITGPKSYQDNVQMAFSKIGIQIGKFIITPLATAEAVMNEDEKYAGVAVVDMGAGNTKISVFSEGHLIHAAVVPFAGDVITRDIKEGCNILQKFAEQLKTQYGQAMGDFADEDKVVTIAGGNGWEAKEISFKNLAYIIQARLEEIIDSIYFQIEKSGLLDQPHQGIILTGGTSSLKNILQILKFRTGMDARMGKPEIRLANNAEFNKNEYVTALGLMKIAVADVSPSKKPVKIQQPAKQTSQGKSIFGVISDKFAQQMGSLFADDDGTM